MANSVILLQIEGNAARCRQEAGYVSHFPFYAKTAEEHCSDLLDEAEDELILGNIEEAQRFLKIQNIFARSSLGLDHNLTQTGENASRALTHTGSARVALDILQIWRSANV